jgi:hypothetical protein
MYELVDAGKTDPTFQKIIYNIANRALPGQWKNYQGEVAAVFQWFKSNINYRRDPYAVELLQDVWATMDRRRADCDDAAIWLAAACEVLGNPSHFITVSTRPDNEPSHVYIETYVSGIWTPLDATVQWSTPGWAPPDVHDRKVWTRGSVGLSGDDSPHPAVEGIGMRNDDLDFTRIPIERQSYGMRQVLPEDGAPFDITRTRMPTGEDGQAYVSQRDPGAFRIAQSNRFMAQQAGQLRPYPIESRESSFKSNGLVPSSRVPRPYNKDAWTGSVPDAGEEAGYLLPQKVLPEGQYMTDLLSGLGSTAAVIGDLVGDAASIGSNLLQSGDAPDAATAAKMAAAIAVDAMTPAQKAVAAAAVTAPKASSASWAIPTGVLVLVAGVGGYLLLTGKKKRR